MSQGIAFFKIQDLQEKGLSNQKNYIFIRPQKGSLGPGEYMSLDFTILFDNRSTSHLAHGGPLDEILVLEIRNGRHIFISLVGNIVPTCFGLPLAVLAAYGGRGVRNVAGTPEEHGGGMPDELWRMTDFIMTYGHNCGSLFLERGDEGLCREIRECLDCAKEWPGELVGEGEIGVLSMAETVIRFLDALPEGIVLGNVYEKVMRIVDTKGSVMQVPPFFFWRVGWC